MQGTFFRLLYQKNLSFLLHTCLFYPATPTCSVLPVNTLHYHLEDSGICHLIVAGM